MQNPVVITLHGESGSGKDSTYQALREMKSNLPRVSFGDMLRKDVYEAYNYDVMTDQEERQIDHYFSPVLGSRTSMTFKQLMLEYGRLRVLENPFSYAERITKQIHDSSLSHNSDVVVVTDARRPHELEAIYDNFRTYSFRVFYEGSTAKALDHLLDEYPGIVDLSGGNSPEDNANQIIDVMIRTLPHYPSEDYFPQQRLTANPIGFPVRG